MIKFFNFLIPLLCCKYVFKFIYKIATFVRVIRLYHKFDFAILFSNVYSLKIWLHIWKINEGDFILTDVFSNRRSEGLS